MLMPKVKRAIILSMPFLGGTCLAQSAEEDGVTACERLVADYAYYRDHMDADNFENLFTEDATLGRHTTTYRGRQAMRERITLRDPAANMTIFTSVRLAAIDETTVGGTLYGTVLSGDRLVLEGDEPLQLGSHGTSVEYAEYRITCKLVEDGWKIADLSMRPIFRADEE